MASAGWVQKLQRKIGLPDTPATYRNLAFVATWLKNDKASQETEDLLTDMQASADFASQVDANMFEGIMRALSSDVEPAVLAAGLGASNPYTVASCLHFALKLLPEPIIPYELFNSFIGIVESNRLVVAKKLAPQLKFTVEWIAVAQALAELLAQRTKAGENTRLLTAAFTQLLLRPRPPMKANLRNMMQMAGVYDALVTHHQESFSQATALRSLSFQEVASTAPVQPTVAESKKSHVFCSECGSKLKITLKFCTTCGNKITQLSPSSSSIAQPSSPSLSHAPDQADKELQEKKQEAERERKVKEKEETERKEAMERAEKARREREEANKRRIKEREEQEKREREEREKREREAREKREAEEKVKEKLRKDKEEKEAKEREAKLKKARDEKEKAEKAAAAAAKASEQQMLQAQKAKEEAEERLKEEERKASLEKEARAKEEQERKFREEKEKQERLVKEKRMKEEREKKEREEKEKRKREEQERIEKEELAWKAQEEKDRNKKEAEEKRAKETREREEKEAKAKEAKASKPTKPQSTQSAMAAMWNARQSKADEEQKRNVFSTMFGKDKPKQALRPGDPGYGAAPEGSQSEARVKRANQWVREQVEQLCSVVQEIGAVGSHGFYEVNFKTLFIRYETISDTVVGILQRGKKKFGVVDFKGEMLFQGQSDNVMIRLTEKASSFKA